jgi:hypothetical protein
MADAPKKSSSPTPQERLKAVVAGLQDDLVAMPKFRPADVALAQDFDACTARRLAMLIELSAIAAVDRHATAVAIEVAKQRKEFNLAAQKQQADADVAMQQVTNAAVASLIPFAKKETA